MTQYITSAQNPFVRHVKQLATSARYRAKQRETILDGIHLCDAYLRSGDAPLHVIVGSESLRNHEVSELLFRLDESTPVTEVPQSLYEKMSPLEQGVAILFVIALPEKVISPDISDDALLLDAVQDPGNVGTILRTAAAAGIKDIYLSSGSASAWSPKVLRAGMGAHFALSIHEGIDLHAVISHATVPVLATSLSATRTLYDVDLSKSVAWLFGNEGAGVSSELLDLCRDTAIIIPQERDVESLNVAASAAVCLFEMRRQRL